MRQINQPSEPSFLPNLLSFQVLGIETEQIRDLGFLQRTPKIPFRSPLLCSDNRYLDTIQFILNRRLTHDPSNKTRHRRVRQHVFDSCALYLAECRPKPRPLQATWA